MRFHSLRGLGVLFPVRSILALRLRECTWQNTWRDQSQCDDDILGALVYITVYGIIPLEVFTGWHEVDILAAWG